MILLLLLIVALAASLFANRLTTHRVKSHVFFVFLFLLIIFINQWIQEGSFNYAVMFFLYSLLGLSTVVGGILFFAIFNDLVWRINQTYHDPLKKISLLVISSISIVLIASALYGRVLIMKYEDERSAKLWESLPVCGPDVKTTCKSR